MVACEASDAFPVVASLATGNASGASQATLVVAVYDLYNTLQMILDLPSSDVIWNVGYSEGSFRQRGKVTDFKSFMWKQQHTRTW